MADVHDKETRSYNMSQIRSRNTKPEMLVRKFLHAHGFRYGLHVRSLPCKLDIILPKYKTVIFYTVVSDRENNIRIVLFFPIFLCGCFLRDGYN
jgi:DNA mismatch endonuclease Vsr